MTDYQHAILNALNQVETSSANPMLVTEIFKHCREQLQDDFNLKICSDTLDAMYEQKIINCCFILRQGQEGNYYWPTAKSLQPAKWSSFQIRKPAEQPIHNTNAKPQPFTAKEANMSEKICTASQIRELIKETPGIEHDALIAKLTDNSTDPKIIKKAVDMIIYVVRQGNFAGRLDASSGKTVKRYYSDHDYLKRKETLQKVVENEVHTLEQHHEAKSMDVLLTAAGNDHKQSALDIQEGGSHYKDMKIQPVQYIIANDIGFIEGSVIKYVSRWKNKNGLQDLKKARHFLDILIEQQG